MNILVASDSFKGTLTSYEVGSIVRDCLSGDHHVDILSISDGGEGLIDALENKIVGKRIELCIQDPLRRPIIGSYYLSEETQTAIIESAVACGLSHLDKHEQNPLKTSSFGVGQLIKHAIEHGAKKLFIGIGGTSTNDGGIGLLEALGVEFYDRDKNKLSALAGENLMSIKAFKIDSLKQLLEGISIEVACDVDNILLGDKGATYTFGPQKGASKEICALLEKGMTAYIDIVETHFGKVFRNTSGTGAAGGIGMCLLAFFDALLKPGIELILDAVEFDVHLEKVDLLITGEGKIDYQTAYGKVLQGVSKRCKKRGIELFAICGSYEAYEMDEVIFDEVFPIVPSVASIEMALANPQKYLEKLLYECVKKKLLDRMVE